MVRKNKKAQTINLVTATFVALFVLILIGFAIILGIDKVDPESFFPVIVQENVTNDTFLRDTMLASQANLSEGLSSFSGSIPTIMTILGVVIVLGALAILVLVVIRIRSQAGGGAGSL